MNKKNFLNQEELVKKFMTTSDEGNKMENKENKETKEEMQKVLLRINKESYYKIKVYAAINQMYATDVLNQLISEFIEKEGL